jgi:hypothetical protein
MRPEVDYAIPLFATQGGGKVKLVRPDSDIYVFVEAPAPEMGLGVGDMMPKDWSIVPVNDAARAAMKRTDSYLRFRHATEA